VLVLSVPFVYMLRVLCCALKTKNTGAYETPTQLGIVEELAHCSLQDLLHPGRAALEFGQSRPLPLDKVSSGIRVKGTYSHTLLPHTVDLHCLPTLFTHTVDEVLELACDMS
jgi:hypothetical protein